ncbi:MAG: tol-pal system protein YbgF [Betaproteobacteria bacterium]|nr:tol-pal system protein YbgF [Betaproteobacteria bacterium]
MRQPFPRRLRLLAAALAALGVAHAASAALFDDEEARKRIDATNARLAQVQKQLEDRIAGLESQMKNQGLIDLFREVELIKADIARLRGQTEVLTHELEQSQKRQRDLYVDLDSRLRKLEAAPAAAPAAAAPAADAPVAPGAAPAAGVAGALPPAAAAAPGAAGEQRSYDAALDQFKGGNYAAAIAGFQGFVKAYPKSPLAPSAQYWVGNAQFAQKDYRGAIASQRQLIAGYPDSQKVPDALLNIGSSQFELGDAAGARRTLQELVAKHPTSDAAAKARQRLAAR